MLVQISETVAIDPKEITLIQRQNKFAEAVTLSAGFFAPGIEEKVLIPERMDHFVKIQIKGVSEPVMLLLDDEEAATRKFNEIIQQIAEAVK